MGKELCFRVNLGNAVVPFCLRILRKGVIQMRKVLKLRVDCKPEGLRNVKSHGGKPMDRRISNLKTSALGLLIVLALFLAWGSTIAQAQSLRAYLGIGKPDIDDGEYWGGETECYPWDWGNYEGPPNPAGIEWGHYLFLDFESEGTGLTLKSIKVDLEPSYATFMQRGNYLHTEDNRDGAIWSDENLENTAGWDEYYNLFTVNFTSFTSDVDLCFIHFWCSDRSIYHGDAWGEDFVGATITATLSDDTKLPGSFLQLDRYTAAAFMRIGPGGSDPDFYVRDCSNDGGIPPSDCSPNNYWTFREEHKIQNFVGCDVALALPGYWNRVTTVVHNRGGEGSCFDDRVCRVYAYCQSIGGGLVWPPDGDLDDYRVRDGECYYRHSSGSRYFYDYNYGVDYVQHEIPPGEARTLEWYWIMPDEDHWENLVGRPVDHFCIGFVIHPNLYEEFRQPQCQEGSYIIDPQGGERHAVYNNNVAQINLAKTTKCRNQGAGLNLETGKTTADSFRWVLPVYNHTGHDTMITVDLDTAELEPGWAVTWWPTSPTFLPRDSSFLAEVWLTSPPAASHGDSSGWIQFQAFQLNDPGPIGGVALMGLIDEVAADSSGFNLQWLCTQEDPECCPPWLQPYCLSSPHYAALQWEVPTVDEWGSPETPWFFIVCRGAGPSVGLNDHCDTIAVDYNLAEPKFQYIDSGLPSGQYYYCVYAVDRALNISGRSNVVIVDLPASPDLQAQSFTLSGSGYAAPGDAIGDRLNAWVVNSGDTASGGPFTVAFYISKDPFFSPSDSLLIGGREHLSSISAEDSVEVSIFSGMAIPSGMSEGPAYLVMITDESNVVDEYNEVNNNSFIPIHIARPAAVSLLPLKNALNVPASTNITVTFNFDMDEATINDSTFIVNGRSTGLHQGTIAYDSLNRTATFDPSKDFDEGEVVTVVLTTDIQSSKGTQLNSSYVWSFTIVVDGSDTFGSHSDYPCGNHTWSVFAADLDGNGYLDLATANGSSDDVSVLLNNGDGTFSTHLDYPVGNDPRSVFAADFDGDGDVDLATANFEGDSVSVLLNNGNGTFATHSVYQVGNGPYSVFAADLDADGDLDLTTANWYSGSVSVLLNNGDGTFDPHAVYPAVSFTSCIFAADLDGDGDLDIAVSNGYSVPGNVSVLLNNGDGTFATHSDYQVGAAPRSVFAADLDGDGDLDLGTTDAEDDSVSVLLNNGDGTFATHSVYAVDEAPHSVFAADLDGDGDLDLTTANVDNDNVSVLLNNGDGTFAAHLDYPVGDDPRSVFAADLDGDGDLDLTTANWSSNNVSVLLGVTEPGVRQVGLSQQPESYSLSQNYPNPFNPITEINYALPKDGNIKLTVHNTLGQKVVTLVDERQTAGYRLVCWDSKSQSGNEVSSGIYFYRLQAGDFVQTRKMILLR